MSQDQFGPTTGQDTFDNWDQEAIPAESEHGCLKGCLIVATVLLLVAGLSGWYAAQNWRGLVGRVARVTIDGTLAESGLEDSEQDEIRDQVNRLLAEFQAGRLTQAQMERLLDQLAKSPLSSSVIAYSIERQYFESSGLSDEEKSLGRMTLRRCVRGMFDGDLAESDVDAVLGTIGTKQPDGEWELEDTLTDEELRTFLAEAKSRADAAGIPETVEEVDPSDEIKRIVDSVLNPENSELDSEDAAAAPGNAELPSAVDAG